MKAKFSKFLDKYPRQILILFTLVNGGYAYFEFSRGHLVWILNAASGLYSLYVLVKYWDTFDL